MGECWGAGTATFYDIREIFVPDLAVFCNVKTGRPLAVDTLEPLKVARSI